MDSENDTLITAYKLKALLSYKSDSCKALCSSFIAATIAWFGLYLAYALNTGDIVFPIIAVIGCFLLPFLAYGWYDKGKKHTDEVAKLEAELAQNGKRGE